MPDSERVFTAKLPIDPALQIDQLVKRTNRSASWIICEPVRDWLSEEQRRHDLTLEALRGVDAGRLIDHRDVLRRAARKKEDRRQGASL